MLYGDVLRYNFMSSDGKGIAIPEILRDSIGQISLGISEPTFCPRTIQFQNEKDIPRRRGIFRGLVFQEKRIAE